MTTPKPRLQYGQREQVEIRCESLDQLLPPEHAARDVWVFVCSLDLDPLLERIQSLPGQAGAPAYDPRLLFALWLYATIEGVGSCRELEELVAQHLVYRWLAGGLTISYRTLSGFRTAHSAVLNDLLTQTIAALQSQGLVTLQRVAQDGLRVRAAAGASSMHRQATLEKHLHEARAQVEALAQHIDDDAGAASRRVQAARQRAARERLERLQAAQEQWQHLQAQHLARWNQRQDRPQEVRVSETDPEARRMKMADGGFRTAYNVQLATETDSGMIVGWEVSTAGSDGQQLTPMLEQLQQRYGQRPEEVLVDGGFVNLQAIHQAQVQGSTVYAPVKHQPGQDAAARKKRDTEHTAAWRQRMATPEAKAIYTLRASTAEWVNAQCRNRGLYQVRVRGRAKVYAVLLWYVLAHNWARLLALAARQAPAGVAARQKIS